MPRIWLKKVKTIALLDVEAVVCSANTGLSMGSGNAGAIWRYGGQIIQDYRHHYACSFYARFPMTNCWLNGNVIMPNHLSKSFILYGGWNTRKSYWDK